MLPTRLSMSFSQVYRMTISTRSSAFFGVWLAAFMLAAAPLLAEPTASQASAVAGSSQAAQDKPADKKQKKKKGKPADKANPSDEQTDAEESNEDKLQTVSELEKKCERIDGLFTLLRDKETGESYLLVKEDQLNKPYITFSYTENGVARLGHFRGRFRRARVFTIERDYQRLRFVRQPTRYYYDPESPLQRSALANVSQAVLAAQEIVAMDEKRGEYVISADDLFLTEALAQIKRARNDENKKRFALGKLNKNKSRIARIRSYPKNTDIIVEYVYDEAIPLQTAEPEEGVTDSRYVTITMQHSLIEMPKNGYQPRRDDPRVGYFMLQIDDMTSTSATPYRDVICRWNLEKKDPDAALSLPKKPIVFWLENTTPLEFRKTIRKAVLAWNEAFEEAGFKNAIRARVQPDDADWDAGDIRYNVIRWTSSPDPQFGGYGPSFVNPRTGEILGADIMIEWTFVTNRVRYRKLFAKKPAAPPIEHADGCLCDLSNDLHADLLMGRQALAAAGASQVEMDRLLKEALYYLILHEVGHTLGLMHNFHASHLHPYDSLHDRDLTSEVGLVASVMDYPAINIALRGEKQGNYYTGKPGPYDKWAIEYGYSPTKDDPAAEENRLKEILARSTDPQLAFGNDADDMRYPGRGIDPRIMTRDMSSDSITWARDRLVFMRGMMAKQLDNYDQTGESYQQLRNNFFTLTRQQSNAAKTLSRFVGGVYIDRSMVGQAGADQPFTPVEVEDQRRAMQTLTEYVFAPESFDVSPELLAHLQQQRRGFDHSGETEDIKFHDHILTIHRDILDHLLHAKTLRRVTDSGLYGNEYSLGELFRDLTKAIFAADARQDVNTIRQNLQIEYVRRLIRIAAAAKDPKTGSPVYDYRAQSMALYQLQEIRDALADSRSPLPSKHSLDTRAHHKHLELLIDRALTVD